MSVQVNAKAPLALLRDFLHRNPAVKYIRCTVIDYSAVSRSRLLTVARALDTAQSLPEDTGAISTFGRILWVFTMWNDSVPNMDEDGYDHWIPDYSTLRPGPAKPEEAMVLCDVKAASKDKDQRFGYCPRSVLRDVVLKAAVHHELQFQVGFEIEFMLLPNAEAEAPVATPRGCYYTAPLRLPHSKVLYQVVDALASAGVQVWGFHSEEAWAQFEIALYPDSPLQAVDDLVYALETIRTLASKAGYHATTHPYPFEGGTPVGRHINISASHTNGGEHSDAGKPTGEKYNDHFLAGLLKHMRPLSAFLLGGYDSWRARGEINGHRAIYYATHKSSPIRTAGQGAAGKRWELRKPDCLGNPYLQIAAIISAGMQGVKDQLELTQKPVPRDINSPDGPVSEEARREAGVTEDLPMDLEEALGCLKAEKGLFEDWMGEMCIGAYLQNKAAENKDAKGLTAKERRLKIVAHI
ncbi:hypothetical protein IAU59_004047 [Kwoniella sp. CBS 9459]